MSVTLRHKRQLTRNLRLIKLEAIVTCFILGAVMTIYLQSKGFTIGQIVLTHVVHVAAGLTVNIPSGYLADKTSRKACNLIGDALATLGIALFAISDDMPEVIIVRVIIGVGMAFSIGADAALMQAASEQLGEDSKTYAKHQASTMSSRTILMVLGGLAAGLIVTWNPTLAMLLAAVPYVAGTVISCFIKEVKAPNEPKTKSLKEALRFSWTDKRIRWTIATGSITGIMAGLIQDLSIPLVTTGGYSVLIASFAWSGFFAAWSLGSRLYKIAINTWPQRKILVAPVAVFIAALSLLAVDINKWTVTVILFVGLAYGWLAPHLSSAVAKAAPSEIRATIRSINMTAIQVAYILSATVLSQVSEAGMKAAMIVSFILFVPPCIVASSRMCKLV